MKTMTDDDADPPTAAERAFLEWLNREDFSKYGESFGKTLDAVIAKGLAFYDSPPHTSGSGDV